MPKDHHGKHPRLAGAYYSPHERTHEYPHGRKPDDLLREAAAWDSIHATEDRLELEALSGSFLPPQPDDL